MAHLPNTSISLRVLGRLLSYPNGALLDDLDDMRAALLVERALSAACKEELYALIRHLKEGNPLENESEFVQLFDCGHSTSLHLFEHVHGDSRDRGPAMVDLVQTYEKAGLFLAPGELPDFLPTVLEFVSTQPAVEARAFLDEMAHIFKSIFSALQQRRSAYASVLGALLELTGEEARAVALTSDEALDTTWEEPPVFAGCSAKGQASPIQSMHFVRNEASRSTDKVSAHIGVSP